MSYPTGYERQYDFQGYQNSNPTRPLPGDRVNADLNAVENSIAEVIAFIENIARADGALTNGIVTVDALSDAVKALIGDADVLATLQAQFDAVDANLAQTAADVVTTTANAASTAADAASTAADVISTAADAASTAADAISTAADAASTAADAISTAADAATATTQAGLAQAAATAAASSLDSFDDRYLGSKAADPTLDNDGNALLTGALYWNTSTGLRFYDGAAWQPYSSSGIGNVVEDTTPQLGGQLDVNGKALGDGTLELLKFSETASAVNEITIANAATGGGPTLSATGDDANIDLNLSAKGTGSVKIGGSAVLKASNIGVTVQGYDANILKAGNASTLAAGFLGTPASAGTKSSGTYTPNPLTDTNCPYYTNGGAHTLAPPATAFASMVIEVTNNASAGAITTSSFTRVTGSTITTTNGHKFLFFVTKHQTYSHLHVQALQ